MHLREETVDVNGSFGVVPAGLGSGPGGTGRGTGCLDILPRPGSHGKSLAFRVSSGENKVLKKVFKINHNRLPTIYLSSVAFTDPSRPFSEAESGVAQHSVEVRGGALAS